MFAYPVTLDEVLAALMTIAAFLLEIYVSIVMTD